ncbi:MAG: hypothetical protein Q4B28_04890 [bacterium]|nr:hypothetical protein [bacterium]
MKLTVNPSQRYAKMRAHTATHLLHAELAQFFPETKQAGSLVDSDFLRFDFYADRLLTPQELAMIEKRINQMIYLAREVKVEEMSIEAAGKLGAKMFFEEKYGDVVRVVQIVNDELPQEMQHDDNAEYFASYGEVLSIELCGGTHVANTREIGAFTIVSQEAVASGIKRITAVTGHKVVEKIENQTTLLWNLAQTLEVKSIAQLLEKANKVVKEFADARAKLEAMEMKVMISVLHAQPHRATEQFDIVMQVPADLNFKALVGLAKERWSGKNVLIGNEQGNFLILAKE